MRRFAFDPEALADCLPRRDDDDDEEEADEQKTPKLDNVLRQWTAEEIPELDVKVLKAKISALEGAFPLVFSHCNRHS